MISNIRLNIPSSEAVAKMAVMRPMNDHRFLGPLALVMSRKKPTAPRPSVISTSAALTSAWKTEPSFRRHGSSGCQRLVAANLGFKLRHDCGNDSGGMNVRHAHLHNSALGISEHPAQGGVRVFKIFWFQRRPSGCRRPLPSNSARYLDPIPQRRLRLPCVRLMSCWMDTAAWIFRWHCEWRRTCSSTQMPVPSLR